MTAAKTYGLYGVRLATPLALPCPRLARARHADIRLRAAGPGAFARLRPRAGPRDWFSWRRLGTGPTYLRWSGLFEFLVARDGRDIRYHALPKATPESLSTYLLGQVLSFSLLAFGVEPLHGTVVVVDGEAVGFLGDCGRGKSTVGAAFLRRGYPVLTDDLVTLRRAGAGFAVHPGLPRIKLFPGVARRVLGVEPDAPRLNDGTSKRILPLGPGQAARHPAPLRALYVLAPAPRRPSAGIAIAPLSPGAAFLEVVRASFNTIVTDRARLARQFAFANRVAASVPIRRLSYPRSLSRLPAVCEAVLADLS